MAVQGVTNQVICTSDADPNAAGIRPADVNQGAHFYQDPKITLYNTWEWSVADQVWKQTSSP